ncbi:MAG: hypothetical protein RRZ70_05770 [Synergistaceae bacterium]
MFDLITVLLKYFFAWLHIVLVFVVALLTELAAGYLLNLKSPNPERKTFLNTYKYIRYVYKQGLPKSLKWKAYSKYCPILAFSALFPVCSIIPYFTFIPIMENGADLLQIMQFLLLSEALAIISVYSLSSNESTEFAGKMCVDCMCLYIPILIFITSIATYRKYLGEMDRIFSLNVFPGFYENNQINLLVCLGTAIFVFLIFSQMPHKSFNKGKYFANRYDIPSFSGVSRLLMSSWGLFRTFIVMCIIISLFYTFASVKITDTLDIFSWGIQLISFLSFWLSVFAVRITLVPLSWLIYDKIILIISEKNRIYYIATLSLLAIILIFWETI